ncbi:hypothetical protein SAMN02910447_00698 [Ruminococcus sp. YE71]|uniref:HlyD family efflux transporter periplasmic adaptor subunit n=1 Tax=unclassified Ruminococcus TaxID=2608920 RepID=UPI0008836C87|nr:MULTISPECIES: HlyD family efflux transporter periplasmic adaptor subunit [unclassified Ruminococcus]SDA13666.1 hypothetical protein SAMN02910446_00697 [Ruminococcus sp. YE78]SFW19469.1 hypothetical protein SAMN02910447_00698 [Ruminococcus sp. YE71]
MRSGLFNKITTRVLILLITVLFVLIIGGQVYRYVNDRHDTMEAALCTINEDISFEGVIIRNEREIDYGGEGVISYTYPDGSKVSKGDVVAKIFSNTDEAYAERKLEKVTNEIAQLEKAQSPGTIDYVQPESINKKIDEYYKQLIVCSNSGDYEGFAEQKQNISLVLNIYNIISGISANYDGRIALLNKDAEYLQAQANKVRDSITANETGYFVSFCDGYESRLDKNKAMTLTQGEIEEIINGAPAVRQGVSKNAIGKMFDDYTCLIAGVIDDDKRVTEDAKLELMLDASNKTYSVKVVSVRKADEEGKSVVILSCDSLDENICTQRVQAMQLIFDEYSGIMVPSSAIRFKDGQKGVYVILGENITFKKIDEIYNGDGFVISRNTAEEDHLLLYDQILLEVVSEEDVQSESIPEADDPDGSEISADSGQSEGDS